MNFSNLKLTLINYKINYSVLGFIFCMLKKCAETLQHPLYILFNESLKSSYFPTAWKLAHVVPIYKSGDKSLIQNYRPVSLLNIVSKVFEVLVYERIFSHVRNMISDSQHGFYSGRSTTTNLLNFSEYVYDAFDNRCQVDTIYTDFSKAFDKVNHAILLSKLGKFGIHGSLLRWIKSYLLNRSQLVTVNACKSNVITVPSGVPQGSHLGPLFFLLFINDIGDYILHGRFLLYADDLKLFLRIINIEDCHLLQQDLDSLLDWCNKNKLFFNFAKCVVNSYTKGRNVIINAYTLDGKPLARVSEFKDLGVWFDTSFTYILHIRKTINKCFQTLGFIRRVTVNFTDPSALFFLYNSMVRSLLEYACVVWSPYYGIHEHSLQRVQNKFLKFCGFRNLQIQLQPLKLRRELFDIMYLYKILNNHVLCSNLLAKINLKSNGKQLRTNDLFGVPFSSTSYRYHSPLRRMARLANVCMTYDLTLDWFFDGLQSFRSKALKCLVASTQNLTQVQD